VLLASLGCLLQTIFVSNLARTKTRQAPAILQQSVEAALTARWTATLTHAAMAPFAANLLGEAT